MGILDDSRLVGAAAGRHFAVGVLFSKHLRDPQIFRAMNRYGGRAAHSGFAASPVGALFRVCEFAGLDSDEDGCVVYILINRIIVFSMLMYISYGEMWSLFFTK